VRGGEAVSFPNYPLFQKVLVVIFLFDGARYNVKGPETVRLIKQARRH
jgi:hypothetical protein